MKTTNEYKEYILENIDLKEILCRSMMGEYLLYYKDILFGGIYNNRLLIKIVDTNKKYHLNEEIPYEGAKPMYHIEDISNKELVKLIILDTCKSLPPKKGKK